MNPHLKCSRLSICDGDSLGLRRGSGTARVSVDKVLQKKLY